MKRKIIVFLLVLFSCPAWAGGPWKVTFYSGDVSWRSLSGGQWKKCVRGDVLSEGALLRTGPKSTVSLEHEGRRITLGPETTLSLKTLASAPDEKSALDLAGAASRLLKNLSRERINYRTETLGVRGDDRENGPDPSWTDDLESVSGKAVQILEGARDDYNRGRYAAVASALKDDIPGMGLYQSEERSCLLGMSYFHLGYYSESVRYLERAAAAASLDSDKKTRCAFLMALSGVYLGDHENSMTRLEALARNCPDSIYAPRACFILAGLYRFRGSTDSARYWYKEVLSRYPRSDLAGEARQKLSELERP